MALSVSTRTTQRNSRLAEDPSLCFAEVLDRYALDYEVSEGSRARFVPVVLISQEKLDPKAPGDRFINEMVSALDIGRPAEEIIISGKFKIPSDDGPVMIFWPFVLDVSRYVTDIRRRQQR
jgi:hypothetical protein